MARKGTHPPEGSKRPYPSAAPSASQQTLKIKVKNMEYRGIKNKLKEDEVNIMQETEEKLHKQDMFWLWFFVTLFLMFVAALAILHNETDGRKPTTYTDSITGCEYLIYNNSLLYKLDQYGNVICGKKGGLTP